MIPTSDAVIVTDVGFTAVFERSDASETAPADTVA